MTSLRPGALPPAIGGPCRPWGTSRDLLNMRVIHRDAGGRRVWLTCENSQLLSLTQVDQHSPMITRRLDRPEGPHHDDHVALDVIPARYQEARLRARPSGRHPSQSRGEALSHHAPLVDVPRHAGLRGPAVGRRDILDPCGPGCCPVGAAAGAASDLPLGSPESGGLVCGAQAPRMSAPTRGARIVGGQRFIPHFPERS